MHSLWSIAASLLYTPFLIRRIGVDHYGLYILLMSFSSFLGVMNLGLGEATLRYVAHYYGQQDLGGIKRVVGATLGVYSVIGFIGVAVMFVVAPLIVGLLAMPKADYRLGQTLLEITSISFAISLFARAVGSIPSALQRFDISVKVLIAESCFQIGGSVIIIVAGYGLREIVLWNVVTMAFVTCVNVIVSSRLLPNVKLRPSYSLGGIKEVLSYGIFSSARDVLGIIWSQADRLILGSVVSIASVGLLTVPQTLSFRVLGMIGNAGSVLFPKFSTSKELNEIQKIYITSTWVLLSLTVVIFVPMTALMPDLLRLWIGSEFSEKSAWIGQIIAFSCIIRGAFVSYENLFKGLGKPQYLATILFFSGATSLLLNVLLIPSFGLAGAGYCYAITPIWGIIAIWVSWRYLLKQVSLKPLYLAIGVPCTIGMLILPFFLYIRSLIPNPGWIELGSLAIVFLLLLSLIILMTDYVLGKNKSHAAEIFAYLRRRYSREKEHLFESDSL